MTPQETGRSKRIVRRRAGGFLTALSGLLVASLTSGTLRAATPVETADPIPVILVTDIGSDIDDTWALGFLLKCPELDLQLLVTDFGRIEHRTKVAAKFLQQTGHGQIPIAQGEDIRNPRDKKHQTHWVEDYDLAGYPGGIRSDGAQALVDHVMAAPEPITIISVCPAPVLAKALQIEPRIADRARLVGMYGGFRRGYFGATKPVPESNVVRDVSSFRQLLAAPWDITITPLDTCGEIRLTGAKFARVLESADPVARAIIENYRPDYVPGQPLKNPSVWDTRSSIIFDTVAIYIAFAPNFPAREAAEKGSADRYYPYDLCNYETHPITVTDKGLTQIDDSGRNVKIAITWKDLAGFEDFLVERLAPKNRP